MTEEQKINIEGGLATLLIFGIMVGFMFLLTYADRKAEKLYGPEKYEFVIMDSTIDRGFTGRTKYRIKYKYRLTNRPDNEENMIWHVNSDNVSWDVYNDLTAKKHFYKHTFFL